MRIEFQNVTVAHADGTKALDAFSCVLDAAAGPVALLGANGAGKSTLFAAILGLLPLAEGAVMLDGIPVTRKNVRAVRARIGLLFQDSDDQLFSQTVRDDVAFGPSNLGLSRMEVRTRANDALERLGIASLADRDVTRLSGGEKRRAALAGLLVMRPEALLLDEPTAMLDPRGVRELGELLTALPVWPVLATHDLAFARNVCRTALVLRGGRLAAQGDCETILGDQALLLDCSLA